MQLLFLIKMSTVKQIIGQCEIAAICNHREILRMKNEYKKISVVPWKEYNGNNNNRLGLDIFPQSFCILLKIIN